MLIMVGRSLSSHLSTTVLWCVQDDVCAQRMHAWLQTLWKTHRSLLPFAHSRSMLCLCKRRRQQRYSRRAEGQGTTDHREATNACSANGRIAQRRQQKEGSGRWRRWRHQCCEEKEGKLFTLNTVIQSFVKALSACRAFASDAARTRTRKARNTVSWNPLQNILFK